MFDFPEPWVGKLLVTMHMLLCDVVIKFYLFTKTLILKLNLVVNIPNVIFMNQNRKLHRIIIYLKTRSTVAYLKCQIPKLTLLQPSCQLLLVQRNLPHFLFIRLLAIKTLFLIIKGSICTTNYVNGNLALMSVVK